MGSNVSRRIGQEPEQAQTTRPTPPVVVPVRQSIVTNFSINPSTNPSVNPAPPRLRFGHSRQPSAEPELESNNKRYSRILDPISLDSPAGGGNQTFNQTINRAVFPNLASSPTPLLRAQLYNMPSTPQLVHRNSKPHPQLTICPSPSHILSTFPAPPMSKDSPPKRMMGLLPMGNSSLKLSQSEESKEPERVKRGSSVALISTKAGRDHVHDPDSPPDRDQKEVASPLLPPIPTTPVLSSTPRALGSIQSFALQPNSRISPLSHLPSAHAPNPPLNQSINQPNGHSVNQYSNNQSSPPLSMSAASTPQIHSTTLPIPSSQTSSSISPQSNQLPSPQTDDDTLSALTVSASPSVTYCRVNHVVHQPAGSHRTSIAQYIDYERRHAQEQQYHMHKKRQHAYRINDQSQSIASLSVVYLPRGGIYVHTPAGPIQFGMPPETIKDSMKLGLTLPTYFIVPKERFNLTAGINVAEFEFPAYYNFFFKRKRINLITNKRVEPLIRTIFTETLVGPTQIEPPEEYGENVPQEAYPDLMKEMSYFAINPFDKSKLTVDSLLSFHYFDDENTVMLDNGVSIVDLGEEYVVSVDMDDPITGLAMRKQIARVPSDVLCTPVMDERDKEARGHRSEESHIPSSLDPLHAPAPSLSLLPSASPMAVLSQYNLPRETDLAPVHFVPPHFGITMLGNSDGFDANGTTTGFVLWMNRRGIMVDPPPHSGALLKRHGISARLMRGVILTHCHADHDAGTFQKILEEGKVVLMTTQVILDSFLRKYSAISGLEVAFLRKLFVFRPVLVGQRLAVYGGHLEFFYSLHSIPCVGFSAYCDGKSMIYSADSFNDPAGIQRLYDQGFISAGRRDKLINFPWHHDLILHEAGVPPIHTPLATLDALDDDIKRRLYIVHKPSKDVPTSTGLKSALVGPENTLVICDEPTAAGQSNARALEILDLLSGIDLFSGFDLSRALEILQCATSLHFSAGDVLIKQGTYGDTLYVIAMGTVAVMQEEFALKSLTVGDHFGEMSIVTGEKRTASVKALTPVRVWQFSKQEFLYIVRHTDAIHRLKQLGVIQRSPSWQAISANSVLVNLTSAQKTYLQTILEYRTVEAGTTLWHSGEVAHEALLVADGSLHFSRAKEQAPFLRGALVADMRALLQHAALTTTLVCAEAGAVYAISRTNLLKFLDDNPGFKVLVMNRRFIE